LDEDFTYLSMDMRETEVFLSEKLGRPVTVRACTTLDEETLGLFEYVDHMAFKEELWYGREEIALKSRRNGFIAFTVLMEGFDGGVSGAVLVGIVSPARWIWLQLTFFTSFATKNPWHPCRDGYSR